MVIVNSDLKYEFWFTHRNKGSNLQSNDILPKVGFVGK